MEQKVKTNKKNLNKLILIGNGFDLAHGLKTRYTDFILWLLNNAPIYSSTSESKLENLIELVIPSFKNLKCESIAEFNQIKKQERIELRSRFQFIKDLIEKSKYHNWVDVEAEYYFSLIGLYKRLEVQNIERHDTITTDLIKLNSCFDSIKEKLEEYLLTIDNKLSEKDKEINNHFSEDILKSLIQSKDNKSNSKALFLNFNYTSTVELYLKDLNLNNSCQISYIHGKLNDKSNPVIFGNGNEMDTYYEKIERLNDNEFLRKFKSFEYFKTSNYQDFIRFIDSDEFDVYIMGHSCGLSDGVMLHNVFEHPNCKSIKIYYYQIDENKNDFFEKTQDISRHFKSAYKSKMRSIIVPFPECVPLKKSKK